MGTYKAVFTVATAALVATVLISAQRIDVSKLELVNSLRFVNTAELSYLRANGRYANSDELKVWLTQKEIAKAGPVDLSPERLKPYVLGITLSPDAKHYQVNLTRPINASDKSTWCKPGAFSDDRGLIFLGMAINCESD